MKFSVAKNVYTTDISEKAFSKLLRRIALKRPVNGLFVVTEPLYEAGMMEIYNYNELLQPFYRKKKISINIYGIANSRDDAKKIVCDIIDDAYRELGGPYIAGLFAKSS
ncbi:hypothetical protein SAMN06297422_10648 [Lachnospiraceae bacterium]|nr:hypothetical protein SAMN06297422_10648 [Lachnospiraceae bacterium]